MNRRVKRLSCILLVICGVGLLIMYTSRGGDYKKIVVDVYDKKILSMLNYKGNDEEPSDEEPSNLITITNGFNANEDSTQTGKTKVYRHNGRTLERLPDFCTWTLPVDCATLKTPGGRMTIFIHDPEDDPILSGTLKKTGIRDTDNVNIVVNELKKYPDAGFFDFGSHIGVYGLSVAHTLGRNTVSIDPMIENTIRLCKSIQFNNFTDKMKIVYNGISNKNIRVHFRRTHNQIGATEVMRSAASGDAPCDNSVHYAVTLDDIIPIVSFKKAVMKLDVEMAEYFAIQGGLKFLHDIDVRSILMEWYNIVKTPHVGPLVALLRELRYVPYIPYVNGNHTNVDNEDYRHWGKHRYRLDVLWIKQN